MKVCILLLSVLLITTPVITGACSISIDGCVSCRDANPDLCHECAAGFALDYNGGRCTACGSGFGKGADSGPQVASTSCPVVCSSSCNSCTATSTQCLTCAAGHYTLLFGGAKICVLCGYGRG